jgi:ABC-type oligopeptide transport system substrate-binding subunit
VAAAAAAALAVGALSSACTIPGQEPPKAAAVRADVRRGGVLTVATTAPNGLDPAAASDTAGKSISSLLCDTLVTVDPISGELRPGLAESWVVSDGGKSIQIKLGRKHVFSDGSRVESRVVVRSLARLANPATASHSASLMAPVLGYEAYRTAAENGDDRRSLFVGARVIEPYSLEIRLDHAQPEFVRTLADPATAPVQTAAADRDPRAFARAPVCSGPYALATPYEPGAHELRLRRSPRYAGGAQAVTDGGRGWADEVVFRVMPDAPAAYAAWQRDEVDIAAVPDEHVAEVRQNEAASLVSGANGQVEYIGLPAGEESPLRDTDLRQVLSAALDRKRIAHEVYGDSRLPATGFVPPAAGRAYRDSACSFAAPPNASGVKLPTTPIKLYFNDEFHHRALAESVAAQWRDKLGLAVEPVALNWDQFLQKATTGTGFDGAFRLSLTPPQPDPVAYVRPVAHSSATASTNLSRFTNLEVDAMLDEDVAKATDEGDRIIHVRRVEDKLCKLLPLVPVAFGQNHVLVRASRLGPARADGRLMSTDGRLLLRDMFIRP